MRDSGILRTALRLCSRHTAKAIQIVYAGRVEIGMLVDRVVAHQRNYGLSNSFDAACQEQEGWNVTDKTLELPQSVGIGLCWLEVSFIVHKEKQMVQRINIRTF